LALAVVVRAATEVGPRAAITGVSQTAITITAEMAVAGSTAVATEVEAVATEVEEAISRNTTP